MYNTANVKEVKQRSKKRRLLLRYFSNVGGRNALIDKDRKKVETPSNLLKLLCVDLS